MPLHLEYLSHFMSSARKKGGTTKDPHYLRPPNTSYFFLIFRYTFMTPDLPCDSSMSSYCPLTLHDLLLSFNFDLAYFILISMNMFF